MKKPILTFNRVFWWIWWTNEVNNMLLFHMFFRSEPPSSPPEWDPKWHEIGMAIKSVVRKSWCARARQSMSEREREADRLGLWRKRRGQLRILSCGLRADVCGLKIWKVPAKKRLNVPRPSPNVTWMTIFLKVFADCPGKLHADVFFFSYK